MEIIASRCGALKTFPRLVLLALAILVPTAASPADDKTSRKDLDRLKARIAELDRAMASDRRDRDSLRGAIESAERELADSTRSARAAQTALEAQRARVKAAQVAREQASALVDGHRADLARALRASYMSGSPGRLQLLFQTRDANALERFDVDTGAVAGALRERLTRLHATIAELAVAEQALAAEQETLAQRSGESRKALDTLSDAQQQRRGKLDDLARRSTSREAELKTARAEQARVEKLLENLARTLRDSPLKYERGVPFKTQRGRLPWPLRGPLLASFGSRKGGGPLTWSGWWIQAPGGSPVRAVADGRVAYVGWVQRYGLVVILDHPGQYLSLYGHAQESVVEVGQVVTAGTAVATAGTSGGHDRSGVYFEIREGTQAVDPRRWLVP